MDAGRGFFSAPPNAASPGGRTRPVSAGTRLRQKPANAAAHQDFFAQLGVDPSSRSRTGSNASTSSNHSYSSMTARPASAGWRPPPIGGLGSARVTPPPPAPPGALNISSLHRTATTTMATSFRSGGLNVAGAAKLRAAPPVPPAPAAAPPAPPMASAPPPAAAMTSSSVTARSKPTQLFSMDAEELYSDDGWDCDSPSTVLSNPTEEEGATPAAAAADEFAWGDDDAFASPVANTTAPNETSSAAEFETKEAASPPPEAALAAVQSSLFPTESTSNSLGTQSVNADQVPSQETASPFEHARVESTPPPPPPPAATSTFSSADSAQSAFETKRFTATRHGASSFEHAQVESVPPPPPAATPSTLFSIDSSTPNVFVTTSVTANQAPPQAAATEAPDSGDQQQQDAQWEDNWEQQEEPVAAGSKGSAATAEPVAASAAAVAVPATPTTIQTDAFVTPPVEITSPGGAAGEFWGEGDEDELFDHDDHADEEWDESIKDQTSSLQNLALRSSDDGHAQAAVAASSTQEVSFSFSSQPPAPPAPAVEVTEQEEAAPVSLETVGTFDHQVATHSEETQLTSQEETSNQTSKVTQETEASPPLEPSPLGPSVMQEPAEQLHVAESSQEPKPVTSLDAESSPFASAIAEPSSQGNDPNVFPEAPPSVRFLHTPTGTGGPFGRVPSPQGNDGAPNQDGFSSAPEPTAQDAQQASHTSMPFEGEEKHEEAQTSESYAEASVRWNSGAMHPSDRDELTPDEHTSPRDDEPRHNTHHGQSDEEERDSVVSFSGEHSFFPSSGRPSSLYGGSQSSFASHRMYQSSVASTDHDGSSIASFGVSSAGATFGGSERVSEGGAFSDGTVSETPSMVDSSNASTAFGTDFPSVSEGQFSAPGTTIGGSDNASDGGFSDGNASETTSMCDSVSTNPRFVSEFSSSSGHYVTERVDRRDAQEPFAPSAAESDSATAFDGSAPAAAASMFGGENSSAAAANPFASAPSTFPASQQAPPATASAEPSFNQPGTAAQEASIQSAASLFGATAGADVPNPFSSFGASPAAPAPAAEVTSIEEHELPTSDAGDLFGSGPASSGFESSFAQPTQHSYSSSYPTHDQSYNQTGRGGYPSSDASPFNSVQGQAVSSSPFDRPAAASASPFESQSSSYYNSGDPFASRGDSQHGFGNAAPSADSVFSSGGGYNSNTSADHSVSSQFGGDAHASADAAFGGYSRADTSASTAAGHFGQQPSVPTASYGGDQSYNQYAPSDSATYLDQGSARASNASDQYGYQSASAGDHTQATTSTFSRQPFGQSSGAAAGTSTPSAATSGAFGHFSRQSSTSSFTSSSAQRETSAFGDHSRYGSHERLAPGTPDNYSRKATVPVFSGASPAQPSYGSQQSSGYGGQQFGQRSTPGTPDNYSHHSAAEVFGSGSSAQPSYGGHQDHSYQQYGQSAARGPAGGFGDHARSSSSASADAFFGHSSGTARMGGSSTASDFGGERVATPSSSSIHQQPSFSRSGSNTSSYTEQRGSHVPANPTPMRPAAHSHDLNASFGSVEGASFSRHASSSSMSQYGVNTSFQAQSTQQHEVRTSVQPPVDANSFFGGAAAEVRASSFFGSTTTQSASDAQPTHSQPPDAFRPPEVQSMSQFPAQQEHEQQQIAPESEAAYAEPSAGHFGESASASPSPAVEASPEPASSASEFPTASRETLQRAEPNKPAESSAVPAEANAPVDVATENALPPIANENDADQPQAFDGFSASDSHGFGDQTSSHFLPQGAAYPFEGKGYGQEQDQRQQQMHGAASASLQFAGANSSHQYSNTAGTTTAYGGSGMNAPAAHPGSYFATSGPGAGMASPGSYSQQQPQYEQYEQPQPQQPQHHASAGYGYHGGAATVQHEASASHFSSEHEYGAVAGHGYGSTSSHQASHPVAAPVAKTSNKYKDPCVAPPSCLASFGFGGNVVTMFPKRKLRLNIAGSSYRNSPRGVQAPSEFENAGNGELRKGPVSVYHMEQLHPKDKEFEQMDLFPGPLTEDTSDEAVLEYLEDRLKQSEEPTSAAEVEDENERLMLSVLRILVKCNGKLRSDPGTLNPSDPDSPEAQLIAVLSESSKRRNGHQSPGFPAPRKAQPATHPDLLLKHANDLRELLLVGDRKSAVSAAMTAQMWPEAMLIASFTDKEEYRRVLRTYLDEHYATGDPCRALFMSFADQQEKSVQEPKRLLQTNAQQPADSLILSSWVAHAQVLLANRTADTNKILTELGDRLWSEADAVAAAHICYLLAGLQVEAPMPTSKMALLGGDHRAPKEARFYVSPGAVQRTEVYEWAQKQSKSPANLMIPFQGYKLIYAMLLADHGKLETAFKYVTSMLTVIKAVTATMKPGSSMYLEGMKNQLTVLDDRLRQHLGQDRVASVAASTGRGGGRKQGKWGLGSALSIMGKIVNRVVEGSDSATATAAAPNAATPGGLYASEATPPAASYPSTPSVTAPTSAPSYPQQHVQQTPPSSSHGPSPVSAGSYAHATPPPSSHGPSPVPAGSYAHATPPMSQGSAPGSSNGYNRTPTASPAGPYARPAASGIPPSGPFSGNGRQQSSGPFSGNGRPGASGSYSNNGPGSQKHGTVPLMRSQHSMEPPGSNHSNSSFNGLPANNAPQYQQQPPSSHTSQHSQYSQHSQETPAARPAFHKPGPLDVAGDTSSMSQPKTLAAGLAAEVAASLPPTDAATMSGPSSDKGKASPKFKSAKKPARSKTPPPSSNSKSSSGWLSGLSSFIATKMNPEAKVAKLGEHLEAYYDEKTKRWVFPGETAAEEPAMPSAPPTGPPGSAPGSSATGMPPPGANSAPSSMAGGPAPSDDPLAALMAPPPSHVLMKKDPLAAMMAPPSRPGFYGARRGGSSGSSAQRKPPRPQFAVFKPTAAPAPAGEEPSE